VKDEKGERARRRSAARRKARARRKAQQARADARWSRSIDLADAADDHLTRGEYTAALHAAVRAVELNPRDIEIAGLHLEVARQAGDTAEQMRALARLITFREDDPRPYIELACLQLQGGDAEAARRTAREARARVPQRLKDRKRWLAMLAHVEGASALRLATKPRVAELELPLEYDDTTKPTRSAAQNSTRSAGNRTLQSTLRRTREAAAAEPPPSRRTAASTTRPARGGVTAASPEPAAASEPSAAHPPVTTVLEIPLEIASDVDGFDVLSHGAFVHPEEVALAVLAARLRDAESYQTLFAVERAQGLLRLSHQEETARRVLSALLGRALLADEVGLGKTIEAGLVLSEYLLRGRIERALVLAPPSLVAQWREELSSKFGVSARTTEDALFRSEPDRFWSGSGVTIASLATARSPRQRARVLAQPWDLVIVDEAHVLKNDATESYRLVASLVCRFLLLLTATPVEHRVEELYNLVSLIRPGHLGGRAAFLQRFSDRKMRTSEATRTELRSLLAEVMVRNTRALSGVQLPPRFARTVLVPPDRIEGEVYDRLAAALRAIGTGGRTRLLLVTLLQEAGSSPFAVQSTLDRLPAGDELAADAAAALAPAMESARQPLATAKAAALLHVLDGAREPTVVFTRFRATLDVLAATLRADGTPYERIDGNIPAPLRHEAIARLRQRGGVLLSTDVGAEGINLQFCRRIVNFDVPWNPMRIEQRIGRVHRIGQDHPVDVVNLCLTGSIEEQILAILDERLNMFELVVGEIETILGYLDEERAFSDVALDAFAHADAAMRAQAFARIGDALVAAHARYQKVKRFDEEFFRDELGV
jgi:superfamily II DNA or RNA helicase